MRMRFREVRETKEDKFRNCPLAKAAMESDRVTRENLDYNQSLAFLLAKLDDSGEKKYDAYAELPDDSGEYYPPSH